jgi:hypothetical protein
MSENITHTAITDDCVRLALHSPRVCDAFKECLGEHLEIARLSGSTRSGDRFTTSLLAKYRDAWPNRAAGAMLPEKLAFVLGWLCHRAGDRQMKPVFRATDPDSGKSPTDCSIYHDAFLLREVYAGGEKEPYSPATVQPGMESLPASQAVDVAAVEDLLQAMFQRALIGLHTFIPDRDDVEGWMERLFATRQRFYVDIHRYAEVFAVPDPDKMKRFILDVNFYDPADPIIRLAVSLRYGEADGSIDIDEAVEAAESQSEYAQAIRTGYLYIQAASDYFERKLDDETLHDSLDIGKPGG